MDIKPCGCGVEILNGMVIRQYWCSEHAPRYNSIPMASEEFRKGVDFGVVDPSCVYWAGEWEEEA